MMEQPFVKFFCFQYWLPHRFWDGNLVNANSAVSRVNDLATLPA